MNLNRKFLVLMVALAALPAVLSGCGNKDDEATASPTAPSAATSAPAGAESVQPQTPKRGLMRPPPGPAPAGQ